VLTHEVLANTITERDAPVYCDASSMKRIVLSMGYIGDSPTRATLPIHVRRRQRASRPSESACRPAWVTGRTISS
jgi:hypothetical protein